MKRAPVKTFSEQNASKTDDILSSELNSEVAKEKEAECLINNLGPKEYIKVPEKEATEDLEGEKLDPEGVKLRRCGHKFKEHQNKNQ